MRPVVDPRFPEKKGHEPWTQFTRGEVIDQLYGLIKARIVWLVVKNVSN